MTDNIIIEASPLRLPLNTTFNQASSTRSVGESLWVRAVRGDITGIGEGCPRSYVTNENVAESLAWIQSQINHVQKECRSIEEIEIFVKDEEANIDKYPAAWCAVELALLDLFSKEARTSVEGLFGLESPRGVYEYTAIVSDGDEDAYRRLLTRYLDWGFSNFKLKINKDLDKNNDKLSILSAMCKGSGLEEYTVRLDANNLWSGQYREAIKHISQLTHPLLGIEEPIEPKNAKALSEISTSLDIPIILDESLCTISDLEAYDTLDGRFIANIKVSRVGGLLRALNMISQLQKRNWKIIIGAHVGETSVLTRAGMCAARAAGASLLAQEGCFGTILLQSEPVRPSLKFGKNGILDLTKPYNEKSAHGLTEYPVDIWEYGWGLMEDKDR